VQPRSRAAFGSSYAQLRRTRWRCRRITGEATATGQPVPQRLQPTTTPSSHRTRVHNRLPFRGSHKRNANAVPDYDERGAEAPPQVYCWCAVPFGRIGFAAQPSAQPLSSLALQHKNLLPISVSRLYPERTSIAQLSLGLDRIHATPHATQSAPDLGWLQPQFSYTLAQSSPSNPQSNMPAYLSLSADG